MAETTIQSANCFLEGETFTHPWLCLCRQSNRCSSAHGCFTSWATVSGVAEVRVQHCSYFQLNILIWTWRGCLCCSALTWKGETNCWQTKNLRCNKAFHDKQAIYDKVFFMCTLLYHRLCKVHPSFKPFRFSPSLSCSSLQGCSLKQDLFCRCCISLYLCLTFSCCQHLCFMCLLDDKLHF